jgi:hypothetical protein
MPRTTRRRTHVRLTQSEVRQLGITRRLETEPWNEMTRAANASPNHVAKLDRWISIARNLNPALDDDQLKRLALRKRSEHYRELGRKSGEARRARVTAA